jgi:hypothetical protein
MLIVVKTNGEVGIVIQDARAEHLEFDHPHLVNVKEIFPLLSVFESKWWELPTGPNTSTCWTCVSGHIHLIAQATDTNWLKCACDAQVDPVLCGDYCPWCAHCQCGSCKKLSPY